MSGNRKLNSTKLQPARIRFIRWSVIGVLGCLGWSVAGQVVDLPLGGDLVLAQVSLPEAESPMRPILKTGSRGSEVTELQATLKLLGFYAGQVDGVYGQDTATAVAAFQQAAGLTPDGVTGPATWNRLFPPTAALPDASSSPPPSSPSPVASGGSASFPTPSSSPSSPAASSPAAATPKPSPPAPSASAANPAKPNPVTADSPPTLPKSDPVDFPILRVGMKGPAVLGLQERLKAIGLLTGVADGVFGPETLAAVKTAQRNFKLDPDGVVGPATWSALLRTAR